MKISMGFNKRFLKKENIIININNIMTYLNADAIICTDEFSKNVYDKYKDGQSKEELIDFINKTK